MWIRDDLRVVARIGGALRRSDLKVRIQTRPDCGAAQSQDILARMDHRLLGRTGVRVSPLCLGTLNFGGGTDEAESIRIVHAALDAGINLIDTANVYNGGRSEEITGRALRGRRDRVVLATKVHGRTGDGPNDAGGSRMHILQACEDSLRRLGTDWIDLYQVHRPSPEVAVDETLGALTDLVRAGKVRYIGCSTHPAWMVMEALATSVRLGLARYVSEQPPYNLLDRRIENELVPLAQRHSLALLPWAPLAQGILAGRYPASAPLPSDSRAARLAGSIYAERVTPAGIAAGARFAELAAEHGRTPGQLALLWCKDQPAVTSPVIGPRTIEQLDELLPVLEMSLTPDERASCDGINPPGSVVSDFHNTAPWMRTVVPVQDSGNSARSRLGAS
jgi:aryl-alcohol dehydrogenase-like predicted oxidoreductase